MPSPLLINEPPLQVLPSLAMTVGLNEAIVLQQVHYWLNPRFNGNFFEGRHWVHNTYEQWRRQFPFWSERTVKRAVMSLEESGLLLSFITQDFKKTKYYSIDYDRLNQIKFTDSEASLFAEPSQKPDLEDNLPETEEGFQNQGFEPSGQNGLIVGPDCPDRSGQIDGMDLGNPLLTVQKDEENQGLHSSCQIGLLSYRDYSSREYPLRDYTREYY